MTHPTFAARLTRSPLPFDARAGDEAVIAFADLVPELREVIRGAAGCSPYLAGLLGREGDWMRGALHAPEAALEAELAALGPDLPPPDVADRLRQAKRRIALLTALADLGGVWDLITVTTALTRLADAATQRALATHLADEIRRNRIPGAQPDDAETGAGMVALAMGKMGAHELNYSSDIDLICLFDETRFDPADYHDARAAFIRATRKTAATLSDPTAGGYVFRTDLRLRPDASVTPVCIAMEVAERYYESLGRTWERAAYIKARPCAGDLAAGARFLGTLRPFVWRRHLDFAAIQDAHDMILRIRAHKGLAGALALEGHNVKLGQGGIREIEFFTQTRQLIAGGRDPDLRGRDTLGALAALGAKGWVPAPTVARLSDHYIAHRELEHRLQMVGDAQTQIMPATPEGLERIARFMGWGDTDAWRRAMLERFNETAELTEAFFAPGEVRAMPDLTQAQAQIVEGWRAFPALRSTRAQDIFARLKPDIVGRLLQSQTPDEALVQFDRFLGGLPAGVQVFSLFEANPSLIDLVIDICTIAPRLGEYLSRNAGVFDAVIGGGFFAPWPDAGGLAQDFARRCEGARDYEARLDLARHWLKEWHFRVGVHHLRGLVDAFEAGGQYAQLADTVIAGLWPHVVAEFARKHGTPPGRGAVVLGMGSLGAGRLNAASDLDLIVIYDAQGDATSDGPRPLALRPYYARLTQALVTALSAPMAGGRLYEVDMRLRPSGRQGPVAASLQSFMAYQRDEAWTWEHLALTRARVVAGAPEIAGDLEAFRVALLRDKGQGGQVAGDVADMRRRLQMAKPATGDFAAKDGPGRIQDIELLAQTGALRAGSAARRTEAQLAAARRAGLIDAGGEATLARAYRLCWRVHCAARLLGDRITDPGHLGAGAQGFIARDTGAAGGDDLARAMAELTADAARVIDAALGIATPIDGAPRAALS
jgi:glutamate-ammonia-ligase adenylyltransferase